VCANDRDTLAVAASPAIATRKTAAMWQRSIDVLRRLLSTTGAQGCSIAGAVGRRWSGWPSMALPGRLGCPARSRSVQPQIVLL
jgi:hypothetical protein